MARNGRPANSFGVLDDGNDAEASPSVSTASGKRRRRRAKKKTGGAATIVGGNTANDRAAVVVTQVVKRGFTADQARGAMEAMWAGGVEGFDDVEAVISQIKKSKKGGKAAKGQGAGPASKPAPAAAAPAQAQNGNGKKAAKAAKAAAAAAPAPMAAAGGDDGGVADDESGRLEEVARMADLSRVLTALSLWAGSASDEAMDSFYSCKALPLLIKNVLEQNQDVAYDDDLAAFFSAVIGASHQASMAICKTIRSVGDAMAVCSLSPKANKSQIAEAVLAAADRIANSIRSFREVSARQNSAESSLSSFQNAVNNATTTINKLAKAEDTKSLFQKRDNHEEIVTAFEDRIIALRDAAGVAPSAAPSTMGDQLSKSRTFDSAVASLAPTVDRARAARAQSALESVKREEAAKVAPLERSERDADDKVARLRDQLEALQNQVKNVEAELKAANAKRHSVQTQKSAIAKTFAAQRAALDSEHAGIVSTLERSDAVTAARTAVRDLDSRLTGLAASSAGVAALEGSAAASETRRDYIDAVLAYAQTEVKCIDFLAQRVRTSGARLDSLSKELASYEELRMGDSQVANNVRAEIEKQTSNAEEDRGAVQALTDCIKRIAGEMMLVVKTAAAGGGRGIFSPIQSGEAVVLMSLRDVVSKVGVTLDLPHAVTTASYYAQAQAAATSAASERGAATSWSQEVEADDEKPVEAAAVASSAPARVAKPATKPKKVAAAPPTAALPRGSKAITVGTTGGGLDATPTSSKKPTFSWGQKAPAAAPARSLADIQREEIAAAKEATAGADESKASDEVEAEASD